MRLPRLGLVHAMARRFRSGRAFWVSCLGCTSSYLRAPTGPAYTSPCPSCDECLRAMGAIGIDVAVAIIAANRTEGAAR
jgi:hypothetical protein